MTLVFASPSSLSGVYNSRMKRKPVRPKKIQIPGKVSLADIPPGFGMSLDATPQNENGLHDGKDRIGRGLLKSAKAIIGRETVNIKFVDNMNSNPNGTLESLMRMLNTSPDAIIGYGEKHYTPHFL